MLLLAKPFGAMARMRDKEATLEPFKFEGMQLFKVLEKEEELLCQSQPLSFIMWDSSMMYFPSLYF